MTNTAKQFGFITDAEATETVTLANGSTVRALIVNASEVEIGDRIVNGAGAVVRVAATMLRSLPEQVLRVQA